jgi:predicted pyridoxine 5'-phosphate oxidase superfamily flavin-nucleotide-binding protein
MVNLTPEMKDALSKMKISPVATASRDGTPNVVPIGFCQLVSDDTIWIVDNFMNKTLTNLKENPKLAVYVWGPEIKGCFQIKGTAEIITSGKTFEDMKMMVNEKKPGLPARSLIVMTITDVFECMPGPAAGQKLL